MIERARDVLQWAIEAEGLDASEIEELGEPGDRAVVAALIEDGYLVKDDDYFIPTKRGIGALAPN